MSYLDLAERLVTKLRESYSFKHNMEQKRQSRNLAAEIKSHSLTESSSFSLLRGAESPSVNTFKNNVQYEQADSSAVPVVSDTLQMVKLAESRIFEIGQLRKQLSTLHPASSPAIDADANFGDGSPNDSRNDWQLMSQSPWEGHVIAGNIDKHCKDRIWDSSASFTLFNDHASKFEQDRSFLHAVHYLVFLTTALITKTPDPKPAPMDIVYLAKASLTVNKCLETLRHLRRLDLDLLRSTTDAWPRWRSDRVTFLNHIATQQRDETVIEQCEEDQALDHVSRITVAASIPAISQRMLRLLEQASEQRDWGDLFLERQLLKTVRENLEKHAILYLPWTHFPGTCEVCSQISLRAMAGDPLHRARTCVRLLRCAQSSFSIYTDLNDAPEYMCAFGAFLFKNVTVEMSRLHFIRLKQPTTVSGCLEFGLSKDSQEWDGWTKILKTTGFENCENDTIDVDVAAPPGSEAARKIKKRRISSVPNEDTINLLEDWIGACDSSHEECGRWAYADHQTRDEPPTLPTRVIDLGAGTGSSASARLKITHGAAGRYTALSYCWGEDTDTFTTRRENLCDMVEEIPLDDLPAAFLDAFEISRRLNIRYIWIDALCIVQDDSDDWATEARKMGAVYQSAYVTIAATCSAKVSQPFLPKNRYQRQIYFDLPCEPDQPEAGTFSIVVGSRPDAKANVKDARLNSRGWVLQERLLSRRILHFAKDQIYWECRHEAKAEDGSAFPQHLNKDFLFPLPGLMKRIGINSLEEYTQERDEVFQRSWLALLGFYAVCRFTRASDRLIALSSLVNKLRPLTKRTYIDGNWFLPDSNVLPQSLFWRPEDSVRSKDPTAPSWSWTTRVGQLDFAFHNRGYTLKVALVSMTETHKENRRSLHLRGRVITAQVGEGHGRSYDLIQSGSDGKQGSWIGSMYMDDKDGAKPDFVHCLYLFDDIAGYPIYWALRAVSSTEGSSLSTYERIGTATQPRNSCSSFNSKELLLI